MDHLSDLADLRSAFARGGIPAALACLNGKTSYRFTALYQFNADTLHNLAFFDREEPAAGPPDDIPVEASYCVYVRDAACPFRVADALADDRVAGHPKRRQVRAYCGVPLTDESGRMMGTVCHFDFGAVPDRAGTVELLEAMSQLLARTGR